MYARTIVSYLIPGKADEAILIFREKVVPVISQQPGLVNTAIYIDRENNMAQTVSVWESKEALEATGQGSAYLTSVLATLRGCLVNRDQFNWEVGHFESAGAQSGT